MEGHAEKCVERCGELAGKRLEQLVDWNRLEKCQKYALTFY